MAGLRVRKLADKSEPREKMFDPATGDPILMTPEDAEKLREKLHTIRDLFVETPRPFAGLQIEGKPPRRVKMPTTWVARGISEGWLKGKGKKLVHRSAGPPGNPWASSHTFVHYETITLRTVDGDVVYKIRQNPDKWPDKKEAEAGFGGDVRWVYEGSLVTD